MTKIDLPLQVESKASPSRFSALFNRWVYGLCRHWLLWFGVIFGIYVGLPFLAPVFMYLGWDQAGGAVYKLYSFLCHQLPERSFFLFGTKTSYTLGEIQAAWQNTNNPMILRQFTGNAEMGWKVAWSDRMVSMYASLWVFAMVWRSLRRPLGRLPWWGFVLLLLPMAVDGTSHLVSDLFGIGQGFRDSNLWLAALTKHIFSPAFYAGDALGSFNSWMRLLTGILFGLGVVWFAFPYIEEGFTDTAKQLEIPLEA